jgi:hypothetical protein
VRASGGFPRRPCRRGSCWGFRPAARGRPERGTGAGCGRSAQPPPAVGRGASAGAPRPRGGKNDFGPRRRNRGSAVAARASQRRLRRPTACGPGRLQRYGVGTGARARAAGSSRLSRASSLRRRDSSATCEIRVRGGYPEGSGLPPSCALREGLPRGVRASPSEWRRQVYGYGRASPSASRSFNRVLHGREERLRIHEEFRRRLERLRAAADPPIRTTEFAPENSRLLAIREATGGVTPWPGCGRRTGGRFFRVRVGGSSPGPGAGSLACALSRARAVPVAA